MVYATSEYLTQTGHRALPELVPQKTLLFVPQHANCVMVRLPFQSEGTDSNSGVNLFGRWATFSENSKHIIEINIKNGQPKSGKVSLKGLKDLFIKSFSLFYSENQVLESVG